MSNFVYKETAFPGLTIIEPKIFTDARGYFMETYNERASQTAGLRMRFVQDNVSRSQRGVLRGLHFQRRRPQGKLIWVLKGEIFDVAVDLRNGSPTFGKYFSTLLSGSSKTQIYIPEGFAHGFLVLSEVAEFVYKCTDFYAPDDESGIIWNDPAVAIDWPIPDDMKVLLSPKDERLPSFDPNTAYFSYQS